MLDKVLTDPDRLQDLLDAILRADGCSPDEAQVVAHHLVEASLVGHDSHGVIRVTRYHTWLQTGQLKACQPLRRVLDTPALVQCDGGDGMGQWLAREATSLGIARALAHGSAIIALRRAGHVGRLGAYAQQAAAAGMISLQFCNVAGSRLVAPFGSRTRSMSTAPVAIGVPMPDGRHFILDFATSIVAEGKALVAAKGGGQLPADALVDGEGRYTVDPRALYGDSMDGDLPNPRHGPGALRAMGAHKGSGLALACELLAGALTGNGTNGSKDHRFGNGLLTIIINPALLDDLEGFTAEAAAYVDYVRTSLPAEGHDAVLVPGDPERATFIERRRDGLLLSPLVIDAITDIARDLNLNFDISTVVRSSAQPAQ